jgi:hypothetical protein
MQRDKDPKDEDVRALDKWHARKRRFQTVLDRWEKELKREVELEHEEDVDLSEYLMDQIEEATTEDAARPRRRPIGSRRCLPAAAHPCRCGRA